MSSRVKIQFIQIWLRKWTLFLFFFAKESWKAYRLTYPHVQNTHRLFSKLLIIFLMLHQPGLASKTGETVGLSCPRSSPPLSQGNEHIMEDGVPRRPALRSRCSGVIYGRGDSGKTQGRLRENWEVNAARRIMTVRSARTAAAIRWGKQHFYLHRRPFFNDTYHYFPPIDNYLPKECNLCFMAFNNHCLVFTYYIKSTTVFLMCIY